MQDKNFSRQNFETLFSYFTQKIAFVLHGLHEMPESIFWENKKNIINLLSTDLAERLVKVTLPLW